MAALRFPRDLFPPAAGYFEGIDSERGIAWRVADSLGLGQFLRIALDEDTPTTPRFHGRAD
jgi:hypothetical protein